MSAIGPGTTFGIYRIESTLGRGGMSVVYLAEDPRLARRVAIKVLAPDLADDETFRNRFIRESQLAAGLDHPNIVPVYEAGEIDERLFIAMRYVKGIDLRTMIARDGNLTPDRTARLIRPVAGALDAAHRHGLVHRDVKPANILIALDQDEEHPYLSDFGLTKHTSSKSGLTKTGTFMGTVDYVAPEQIQGAVVDGRTDEYSLACVVYQCLTGAVPFDKETEVATLFAHLQDPLPKVSAVRPDIADELDECVARGMAKDREERYPTCTAMMDAFVDAVGLSVTREPVPFDPTVVAAPPQQPDSGPLLPPAPVGAAAAAASTPPIERPVAEARPEPAGTGGPPRKGSSRLAAIVGGSVLGLAAIVVAIVLLTGGEEGPGPGPGPGPTNPTGTGPNGGVASPLELSGGSVVDIPPRGTGVPYPSTIQVSDVEGVVTDVNVTLEGFSHEFPNDLDVLLVGPGGQSAILAEGVGGEGPVEDVTFTFDDDGVPLTAQQAPSSETTFRPSSNAGDGFGFNGPGAVPPPPFGSALGVFDGTDPNGTWSLFVFDDGPRDAGRIAGGWSLELELAGDDLVIFRDDFSNPGSGWDVFEDGGFFGHYEDGSYVLGVPAGFEVGGDFNTSSQELSTLGDVRVEATARLLGTADAVYGLVCRAQTPDDYYYFLIQGDGTYYIGENHGSSREEFSSSFSPAIVAGEAPNRIAIECVDGPAGVNLRMFVNGIALDTAVDSAGPISSGAAGFRVESRRRAPMEAAFDDFLITVPAGEAGA